MQHTSSPSHDRSALQHGGLWIWLSVAAALLAVVGNVLAFSLSSIYAGLTPAFLPQAIAQDAASLLIVSPLWLVLAVLALRGSLRAYLLWLGVLTFTVYNYVIYTFSVPFGPLYPVWVAVLGLTLFALIGGVATTDHQAIQRAFTSPAAVKAVGWFLIVVSILFAFLWLSDDVPALLAGSTPQSLIAEGLPTNPVHTLDLAFFLPAVIITGVMLLKRFPLGYTLAPSFLVFLILTGVPILITPIVQARRGEIPGWSVVPPIGILTVLLLGLLVWLMSTVRDLKLPA
ncbi:MAG TPA: hypothetical protein VMJ64_12270 [Anaerolineales bacterium]|nr:hypothetical protein [Anaerolineales bacterium]